MCKYMCKLEIDCCIYMCMLLLDIEINSQHLISVQIRVTSLSKLGLSQASILRSRSLRCCANCWAWELLLATSALILTWVLVNQRAIFSMNIKSIIWFLNLKMKIKYCNDLIGLTVWEKSAYYRWFVWKTLFCF